MYWYSDIFYAILWSWDSLFDTLLQIMLKCRKTLVLRHWWPADSWLCICDYIVHQCYCSWLYFLTVILLHWVVLFISTVCKYCMSEITRSTKIILKSVYLKFRVMSYLDSKFVLFVRFCVQIWCYIAKRPQIYGTWW